MKGRGLKHGQFQDRVQRESVRSRLPILERWLAGNGWILCLRDEGGGRFVPGLLLQDLGFHLCFSGEVLQGVAIASTVPTSTASALVTARSLRADPIAWCRFGELRVVNAYVPQGKTIDNPDYPMKLRFFGGSRNCFVPKGPGGGCPGRRPQRQRPRSRRNHPENKKNVCYHEDVRRLWSLCSRAWWTFRKHRPGEGVLFLGLQGP